MEKTKNKNKLGLKIGSWNINGLSKEKWNENSVIGYHIIR